MRCNCPSPAWARSPGTGAPRAPPPCGCRLRAPRGAGRGGSTRTATGSPGRGAAPRLRARPDGAIRVAVARARCRRGRDAATSSSSVSRSRSFTNMSNWYRREGQNMTSRSARMIEGLLIERAVSSRPVTRHGPSTRSGTSCARARTSRAGTPATPSLPPSDEPHRASFGLHGQLEPDEGAAAALVGHELAGQRGRVGIAAQLEGDAVGRLDDRDRSRW